MESRKDKTRLILQPPIWKGVRLCGSSHVERRASSSKIGQASANSSRRRSGFFTKKKTLVFPCSHCFRLDLLTSTSGRFHAWAYVFPTSMNFRERCCLFEVFRMIFDPMLSVNIQKTCLRQLGRQEQLAGARISRVVAKGMRLLHRILPKSPREWIIDGPGRAGATEAWGSLFQMPERWASVQGLSWAQPNRPSPMNLRAQSLAREGAPAQVSSSHSSRYLETRNRYSALTVEEPDEHQDTSINREPFETRDTLQPWTWWAPRISFEPAWIRNWRKPRIPIGPFKPLENPRPWNIHRYINARD